MTGFMKVSDAVKETGLSRAHIYRLVNQGTIQASDDAGVKTVDVDGLKRFIQESASTTRRGRKPAVPKKGGRVATPASTSSPAKRTNRTRKGSSGARKATTPASAQDAETVKPAETSTNSDAHFLRHEVDRLWRELEARRQEHASERDRLLKTIELLSQK